MWEVNNTAKKPFSLFLLQAEVGLFLITSYAELVLTKQPTETTEGVKTFTCTVCGVTKTEPIAKLKPAPTPGSDPNQKGVDGTAVGPGASAACADKAITSMKSDNDPAGSKFAPLKLKSTKQFATSRPIPRSRPSQRRES